MKYSLLSIITCCLAGYIGFSETVRSRRAIKVAPADCHQNCDIDEDNCHFGDVTDCRFYKQCYRLFGKWTGYLKTCQFGLYWSGNLKTCNYHYNVTCGSDRCKTNPQLKHYTHQHELTHEKCNRQFWKCVNGTSLPRCCHEGYTYHKNRGCIKSNCLGRCLLGANDICRYEPEGYRFRNIFNCRRYYQCQNKDPTPLCCSESHRFEYGKCVFDPKCKDRCGETQKPPQVVVTPKSVVCMDYKTQPECPVGQIWGKLPNGCPGCVADKIIDRIPAGVGVESYDVCKKDVLYVFSDFNETKINIHNIENDAPRVYKIWVGGDQINTKDGLLVVGGIEVHNTIKARRRPKPSFLSFPWYHGNKKARFKLYIELRFKSNDTLRDFTLLSDCCSSGSGPSFSVTAKGPGNKLKVYAETNMHSDSFFITYAPGEWNYLRVFYDGLYLRAFVGLAYSTHANKVPLFGKLVVAGHALRFGTCMSRGRLNSYPDPNNKCRYTSRRPSDQFVGWLDYIKIWGCKIGWRE